MPDIKTANQVMRIYELLDELDDSQGVFTNAHIPDDVLGELEPKADG